MNQESIGKLIASLRRERNMTQEALGDKIGVTNKTVSRWENGNYMPDIEMLQLLSKEFGISIDELLCGQRLDESATEVLKDCTFSTFSIEEKSAFWKKKWLKERAVFLVVSVVVILGVFIVVSKLYSVLLMGLFPLALLVMYAAVRNRMMVYVESKIYEKHED